MRSIRRSLLGYLLLLLAVALGAVGVFVERFANGAVRSGWQDSQALRGVSEGDMTRYALSRREPLLAQLEAFADLVAGGPGEGIVTLEEGVGIVATAMCAWPDITSITAGAPPL